MNLVTIIDYSGIQSERECIRGLYMKKLNRKTGCLFMRLPACDIALDIKDVLATMLDNTMDGFIIHSIESLQDLLNIDLLYRYTCQLPHPYNIHWAFILELSQIGFDPMPYILNFLPYAETVHSKDAVALCNQHARYTHTDYPSSKLANQVVQGIIEDIIDTYNDL